VAPGEHHDFIAEFIVGDELPNDLPDADACWRTTEATWRAAVPDCAQVVAGTDVRRSLAVLRGMTDGNGATVAAATTSLPERDDADRNYDYRFCWIRDTCYVGQAGAAIPGGEAILMTQCNGLVSVSEPIKIEHRRLTWETAIQYFYRPSSTCPAIRWHRCCRQQGARAHQLDLFGEALLLFAKAASCDRLDLDGWRAVTIALEAIEKRWDDPRRDLEIEPNRWTESRSFVWQDFGLSHRRSCPETGLRVP